MREGSRDAHAINRTPGGAVMVTWWSHNGKATRAATEAVDCGCGSAGPDDLCVLDRYFRLYELLADEDPRLDRFRAGAADERRVREATSFSIGSDRSIRLAWSCPHCEAIDPYGSYTCARCACALV
jgi:hypothetical protein